MTDAEKQPPCTCAYAFGLRIQNLMCPYHGSPEFVPERKPETVVVKAAGIARAQSSAETHDLRDK